MLHINRPAGFNVLGPTFKADKKIAAVWTPSSASAGNRSNYQTSADNCPCKPESLNKLVSPLETLTSPSNSHATFKSVATLDAKFAQSEEKDNENLIETTSQAALARPVASPVPAPPPPPPKPPSHLSPDNPRRHPAVSPANDQPAIPSLLDYLAPSGPNAEESSASSNQQISEESSPRLSAFVEFDPFRSVIEYPEKQTVAELRNKLETKFNGSMPVKGYMTASGQIIRPEPTRPAVAPRTNMSKIDYRFQPPPGDLYSTLMNQPIATEQPKPNNQSELSPARASHVATTKIDRGLSTKTTTRDYYDDSSEKKPNRSDDVLKSTVDDLRRCIEGAKNAVAREVANSEVPFGFSAKIEERPKNEDKYGIPRINDERARFFESFNPPQPRNGLIRPTEQPNFVRSPSPPRVPPPPQNYSVGVYAETGKLIDHSQRHRFAMENCTGPQNKFYPDQIILPATSDSFSEAEWRPRDYGTTREIKDHHLEKEGQHAWYKEMYQQIHHIDRKNGMTLDESVLRYQMKDYLANANAAADKYAAKESAIQPRRRTNQGDDGHIITYKFSDLRNQTDLGEPNHRRMRSKSASRFENPVLSPPHSDVVRCSSPGERYKHQPKKIEDYVPGTSSVADYEQGKNRHVMASTRCQSSLAYVSGCSRPLSPLVQRFQQEPIGFRGPLGHVTNPAQLLQVRQQYKDVQTGGEVPVSGLSHLGSEMMDYSPTLFNKQAGNKSVGTMPDREFDELAKLEKELVLENERRKKFEKELNDQRSRRHGYVPSKIQTPLMTDQRFDRLLTDYGERSSPGLSSEFRGVARALYPFTAHTPKELSFFKGDLIKIKRAIDANWYEGKLRGVVGIVPANYVELLATAAGDERLVVTEVQKKREGQGIALYNFDGYGLNEIPLRKNEIVRLTRRVDEHWYEGRNDMGRKGIFPANYVRVLQEPSTQLKDYVSALAAEDYSPMPSQSQPGTEFKIQVNGVQYDKTDNSYGLNKFPASSTSAPSDYSAQGAAPSSAQRPIPVKYAGSGGGGNFVSLSDRRSPNLAGVGGSGNTDDLSIDTQFRSIDPSNANADLYSPPGGGVGGNAGGDGTTYVRRNVYDSHKTTYKAVFPYESQNDDELDLRAGDIIYVKEKCDDGWLIGTCAKTGKFGTFPGNYARLVC